MNWQQEEQKSKWFDKMLERQNKIQKTTKAVLIGNPNAGKTTLLKQIQLLYDKENTTFQNKILKYAIQNQAIETILQIAIQMDKSNVIFNQESLVALDYCFKHFSNNQHLQRVKSTEKLQNYDGYQVNSQNEQINYFNVQPSNQLLTNIRIIADDQNFKDFVEFAKQSFNNQTNYFLLNLDRILNEQFQTHVTDYLNINQQISSKYNSIKNLQVKQQMLNISQLSLHQLSLHSKIIQYYKADIILFQLDLNIYKNISSTFNALQNDMLSQLQYFDSVINSKYLINTSIIILFNQVDRFQLTLQSNPFQNYFNDFQQTQLQIQKSSHPDKYYDDLQKSVLDYLRQRFTTLNRNIKRNVYCFCISAFDSVQIEKLCGMIQKIVQKEELQRIGFK